MKAVAAFACKNITTQSISVS